MLAHNHTRGSSLSRAPHKTAPPLRTQLQHRETEAGEALGTLPKPSSKPEKKASGPSKHTSQRASRSRARSFLPGRLSSLHRPQDLSILHLCKFQQGWRSHSQGHGKLEGRGDAPCHPADEPPARNKSRQLRWATAKL